MPRHSARRFLFEVLFLAGVAAALTYAELRPAAIIGLMAAAWAVVALLEWTAWLDEPHYGRGLPPRYYVPHVALPPPVAVEQVEPYPVLPPVEDEPTFVASTQEWGLADWPEPEATAVIEDTVAVPLPPPILEVEDTVVAEVVLVPEEIEEDTEDERSAVVEVVEAVVVAAAIVEPEAPPVVEPKPAREAEPVAAPVLVMPARVQGRALHRVDPLTVSRRRRLFSRGGGDEAPPIEVLDGPPPDRALPSRVLEQTSRR
jgi:hypothetical protein